MKKNVIYFLCFFISAFGTQNKNPSPTQPTYKPEGWSFDLGGGYTWMSFSTPPTYTGNTGGILGRVGYQRPYSFFGQAQTFYLIGPFSSSATDAGDYEWYSEFVGGYCLEILKNWTITPYAGLGMDFLRDFHDPSSSLEPIKLRYNSYYAVAGFKTRYAWQDWMLGLEADCLPIFNQFLQVGTLGGEAWVLENRIGAAVRLPVAYRYIWNFWVELMPYYRFFPVGESSALVLEERNLNQVGFFLTFRFFL